MTAPAGSASAARSTWTCSATPPGCPHPARPCSAAGSRTRRAARARTRRSPRGGWAPRCASPARADATRSATRSSAALAADGIDLRRPRAPRDRDRRRADRGRRRTARTRSWRCPARTTTSARPAPRPAVDVWVTDGQVPPDERRRGARRGPRDRRHRRSCVPAPAGLLPAELVARFDVAVVNETELAALGERRPRGDRADAGRARRAHPARRAGAARRCPARVVDTTGAGDCLTGAVAAALAEGRPLDDAVRLGLAAALALRGAARLPARDADAGRGRAAAQLTFLTPCTGRPSARHWNRVMVGSVSS